MRTRSQETITMKKRFLLSVVMLLMLVVSGLQVVAAQDVDTTTPVYEGLKGAEPQFGAVESVVNFESMGQNVVGTLVVPDGGEAPYPIVLLFHGFTGQRNEMDIVDAGETMYGRTARMLAGQGYASLRIDFRGSGESDGSWEDTTFNGQIADAIAAIDFVETLDNIDSERLGVIGLSQGGLVAASLSARDDRVKTTILWSAVANPAHTYALVLSQEAVDAGLASGGEPVTAVLPWGAETTLRTGFFEELFTVDPVAEIAEFEGPLMVVAGLRDTIVTPQPYAGQAYINYHEGPEMLLVVDGDHMLDILGPGPALLDDVVTWALAWFQQTL